MSNTACLEIGESFYDLVKIVMNRKALTPDYPELIEYPDQKLFVYGTLMQGLPNYGVIEKGEYIGDAETARACFNMLDFGVYPGVVRTQDGCGSYVQGELYSISLDQLMICDRIESNGSLFQRELCKVTISEGGVMRSHTAWIYLLMEAYVDECQESVDVYDFSQTWWTSPGSWGYGRGIKDNT